MDKGSIREKKEMESRYVSLEFLASISHEIRNPLNVIVGLIHLLKTSETEEEKDRYTEELVRSSQVLLDLVNNIMDFSKVDAGKLNYEYKSTDLRKSILQNLAGCKAIAEAKGLDLIIELSDQLPNYVYTDPVKINQVILNLISNAIKFTEEGFIKLLVDSEGALGRTVNIKFEIQDTGHGIPPEKLETIFNAFEQGSDEINLKFGGTGLGLSICKKVVTALGGNLRVQSEVGKGTSFEFTLKLPVSGKKAQPRRTEKHPPRITPSVNRKTILIVDDSEMNTLLMQKTLEKQNFQTLITHDGLSAIKILQEESVDLVLLDIHMPKMKGIEAAGIIRNLPGLSKLPIIAVTGSTDISSLKDLQSAVFSDFILKPFQPQELAQKSIAAISLH